MDADDLSALELILTNLGYWLIDANPASSQKVSSARARVSRRELIEFCSAMSAMLDAGIPIIDAMQNRC